ncbi:MAG: cyclic nucleotide-binding domain-containing protein [Leptospiraceae bacterium]|nr:cyclic nucleotide-binding domain-containing protein [Leptospiraceae bacterium]MCP5495021.1 cyclic nucleotide-binding domain-containing protein [Leptospiraceae bacterium]
MGTLSNIMDYISNVSTKYFRNGEIVFEQGEYSNGIMYFVFEGELSVLKTKQGKKKAEEIGVLEPGAFFGEMALIKSTPRMATIMVKSPKAKLGVIDKNSFIKLSKTSPGFLFILLKSVIERLYASEERLEELRNKINSP